MIIYLSSTLNQIPLIQYDTSTRQKNVQVIKKSHSRGFSLQQDVHPTIRPSFLEEFVFLKQRLHRPPHPGGRRGQGALASSSPSWRSARRRSLSAPRSLCSGRHESSVRTRRSSRVTSASCQQGRGRPTFCSSVRSRESTFICSFLKLAW